MCGPPQAEERSDEMGKRFWVIIVLVALSAVLALPASAAPSAAGLASDPTPLWNTFLGGTLADDGYAVATDAGGNVYVAGTSMAAWGAPIRAYGGAGDAFVAKLNSKGVLQWNTFLGSGTGEARAYGLALDGSGNINVTGESLFSWGAPVHAHSADGSDVFVAQLDKNGALRWNTFHGGQSIDQGRAIAVDGAGDIYVSGESRGTWGKPLVPPGTGLINQEAFAAKLDKNGALVWNTFMGDPNNEDYARGIALGGGVAVTGKSKVTWGNPVRAHSGDWYGDAFVAQLDASTGARQWNTFLGGAETDEGRAIAASGSDLYVTGFSYGTWANPVAPFSGPGQSNNVFVARLNGSGALRWNTFLGGEVEDDAGNAIAVVRGSRIYVAGKSGDSWGKPVHAHSGDEDAFVAQLTCCGLLQWNTFLGGDSGDWGFGIAANDANIYVAGESWVGYGDWGQPVRPGSGKEDAFVVRFGVEPPELYHALLPVIRR